MHKLIVGFLLITILISSIGFFSIRQFRTIEDSLERDVSNSVEELTHTLYMDAAISLIMYLDEVQSNSMRNYINTNDPVWKIRHSNAQLELSLAIQEATDSQFDLDRSILNRISLAQEKIILMDKEALELMNRLNQSGALLIINSLDYQVQRDDIMRATRDYTRYRGSESDQILASTSGLRMAISKTHSFVTDSVNIISTFMILAIILALSLFAITSRSIIAPIERVRNAVHEIGQGGKNVRIKGASNDEMGELVKTFNNMSITLENARKKEETHRRDLKRQVSSKTRNIQKAVAELTNTKAAIMNMMEDLQEANDNLKELDQAKTNFLNIVSHELKTPLTAINAHLEIILDSKKGLSKQQKNSLDAITRNSSQLRMLIENILEISRIESNRFELNITKVNINEIIQQVADNLRILAERKSLKLEVDMGKLPNIDADEIRIREIISNLISNSVKFTESGSIILGARRNKNEIVVSVSDSGIGIPEEMVNKLFTKFFQVDASLGRKYGGTGLGLSITKQLVELQGGKIWVKSDYGKGSVFTFTLPISRGGKK